jgi:hypothetical protein
MTRRRALSPLAIVGLLAGLLMIPTTAVADSHAAITSPSADEIIYQNTLDLAAHHDDTEAEGVTWAVRKSLSSEDPTCLASADVVGNVRGNDDSYSWIHDAENDTGEFSASFDISSWAAGQYCFVVSSLDGDPDRMVQWFYIVDEYVKVGGNIDNADYLTENHADLDLKELRGRGQLSHAFSGVVGNAGGAGIVGSISVNYRQLDETCTFTAESLSFDNNAPGIVGGPDLRAVIGTNADCGIGSAAFFALDHDANEPWDRGAVVVRPGGSTAHDPHLIDGTPTQTGGDSWIPLESGNVSVGTR